MSESNFDLPPYLHPFPTAEDVFSRDVDLHRKHLIPLISIDASFVDPSWSGRLHVVAPKESFDGMVGEYCREFHTETCKDDVLGFRVSPDGKYEFLADFRYFLVERGIRPDSPRFLPGLLDDIIENYENVEKSFSKTRAHFEATGCLNPNPGRQPDRKDAWIAITNEFRPYNAENLKQIAGNELRLVARTTGYSYYDGGPSRLHLYFEPISRIAIIQLDHD